MKIESNVKVWMSDLTYTQQTIAADVMPNAIGGMATYAESKIHLKNPIRIFKYPEKLINALEKESFPEVMTFSNYVWNFQLSYEIIKLVKQIKPNTIVIFGGPNYPNIEFEQIKWLLEYPLIDFYIVKEGEIPFSNLLIELIKNKLNIEDVKKIEIPSVHTHLSNGQATLNNIAERIRDLTEIPSPYVTGKLDEFFDGTLLPIVQTNRGCPFSCTFCIEGVSYYNKVRLNSDSKISKELNYIAKKMQLLRKKGGRNDLFHS